MIEFLPSPGPDVVALRAGGTLTADDIDRAWASLDAALDEAQSVGVYLEIVGLEGVTLAGIVRDIATGLQNLKDLPRFERVAVVTDSGWIQKAAKLEDLLIPGIDVRAFSPEEEAAAMAWLSAHAAPVA